MKIGILTFHNADNYGSVLQAYALKTYVESVICNSDCEIINYVAPNQEELYALYLKNNSVKNIVKNLRALIFSRLLKSRIQEFRLFRENYLNIDIKKISDSKELRKYIEKFDVLVCGSDQIWNPRSLDFSYEYFAPHFSKCKISYAPSFGNGSTNDLDRIDKKRVSNYLKEFAALSVREKSGLEMLTALGVDEKVELVLDPTLFLGSSDWDKLINQKDANIEEPYIFFYSIDYNSEAIKMVQKISKKTGLKVYIMFSTNKTYRALRKGFKLVRKTSPNDFLVMIKNAKIVLSSSFHGVAFSTIFKKDFFALETHRNGEIYRDERIHNILDSFDLTEQIIRQEDIDKINWENLRTLEYNDESISSVIKKSQDFLIENITNGTKNRTYIIKSCRGEKDG